jgi:hypothetical protein
MNKIFCNSIPFSLLWCQSFGTTCFLSIASGYEMEILGVSKCMPLSTRLYGVTFVVFIISGVGISNLTTSGDFFFCNVPRELQGAICLCISQYLHAENNKNSMTIHQFMIDARHSVHHDTIYENDHQDATA